MGILRRMLAGAMPEVEVTEYDAEQKGKPAADFIAMRQKRDSTLAMPRLIIPSLQVNMRASEIPRDKDGNPMLKVPVNGL